MSELKLFQEVPKSAEFHSVVMTTFSFDFHHFESQVLRELKRKGVTNVNIFADTAMLDKSIGFSTGHLKSLSTSYSINSIPCIGAFHPKITILAGDNDVLLLQGSGNITNGGHGKNHELFTVFYANKNDQTQLPIIQEAWLYLRRLTNKIEGISREKLDWVSSNCNLLSNINIKPHQLIGVGDNFGAALLYNEDTSIWKQLNELIPTGTIKKIQIFSPFYDENGALLNKLLKQFEKCTIDAYLQPNRGIHPFKMQVQKDVRFISWESTNRANERTVKYQRKLHSKLFWFDAGEDQYCLIGSPNASIAAFGTEALRGANDEFAVLIKVPDKKILEELKLTGKYDLISPTENIHDKAVEKEIEDDQSKNVGKIKLLGVDQDGKNLTLFIQNKTTLKSSIIALYDNWGQELERQTLDITKPKIRIEIESIAKENSLAFVQFVDIENESLSNKQIANKLHELWNTNPSVENRRLMKLGSLIESGGSGVFDIVEFYNTIQSNRKPLEKKSSSSSGVSVYDESENSELATASLTYEEAIALNKDTIEHQKILKQHSSIRIWDSIEKYFKQLAISEENEDMDDEEDGDASTSRPRVEKKERIFSIPLNSVKVLKDKRKGIESFLKNYSIALKKSISTKDHQIGLLDMAMFLIVMKQLIQISDRKVIFNVSNNNSYEDVVYPLMGNLSELSSFSGATLNIIGSFVNLLCCSRFEDGYDEYTKNKLNSYKTLVQRTSLFSLSIIGEMYQDQKIGSNWADLLAYNIIDKCGESEIEFEKHLSEFLMNTSINRYQEKSLADRIKKWHSASRNDNYLYVNNIGICNVIKRMPLNGPTKLLKLSRPGFEYNERERDFILSDLYNCTSHELLPSRQEYEKSVVR